MDRILNNMLNAQMPGIVAHVLPFAIVPVVLVSFALITYLAAKMLGLKEALYMLVPGMLIAYLLEEIGVHTGIIFGRYYFNPGMGPKLDVVPLVHPFLWVSMIFMAWILTNLLLDGTPLPQSAGHARTIFGAVMTALVVSTLDLTGDPFSVKYGLWSWPDGGRFFGVPYHNWVGWFIVALVTTLIHGYILKYRQENAVSLKLDQASKWVRLASGFPIVFFGGTAIFFVVLNFAGILGLVSVYAMGIPVLLAGWQWVKWYRNPKQY